MPPLHTKSSPLSPVGVSPEIPFRSILSRGAGARAIVSSIDSSGGVRTHELARTVSGRAARVAIHANEPNERRGRRLDVAIPVCRSYGSPALPEDDDVAIGVDHDELSTAVLAVRYRSDTCGLGSYALANHLGVVDAQIDVPASAGVRG